ncbi:TIGR04282 family arsenosugar biosynthesis glycosyltransferase [Streptomyces zaomyceticus]|uniref:TIGR04282 family arsenosugar biosynthesis glycosyltransferase n=1 Tax=Streptomyces zaomyceticus TaxID=68286 RepID=UPI00167BEF52|nr:TIGR04282 family arsenosugar biosynthesis glycosyltransferase [Streptomyces zaomyceticus]GHG11958.1 glycosyl transferase [Streptomyces zaomyceticus]
MTAVLVIAKEPVAGRVKTRLTPHFTPEQAAELARAALQDTLATVLDTPVDRRVLVLDGRPGSWVPEGIEVVPQGAGGLDVRLAAAFSHVGGPALLIGMDTPQITPGLLAQGLDFGETDAWFGPADDGGFWALGLAEPDPALLLGVPMSMASTGGEQRRRLTASGRTVRDLPELCDVDTPSDAALVAAAVPGTRFATLHDCLCAVAR